MRDVASGLAVLARDVLRIMVKEEALQPSKRFHSLLLSVSLLPALGISGCAVHVYDPYHSDYHRWDANERVFYNQWAVETHHDAHRDFKKLNKDDQQAYWNWRHDHH